MGKELEKIEPSFDGEIIHSSKEYLPKPKNKSIIGTLGSVVLYSASLLILFLGAIVVWQIAASERLLTQSAVYLYKFHLLSNKSQAEANAVECWRYQKYDCARKYIELLNPNTSESSQLIAINGGLLSMAGKYAEAAAHLNKISEKIKLDKELINQLCIANTGAGNFELATDWCNVAISNGNIKNYRNIEIVKSFAESLVRVKRYAEALTLLQEYDYHQTSVGNQPYFQSDRIYLESKLNDEPSRKSLKAYKDSTGRKFETVVKLGDMNYGRFLLDTGATANIVVSPEYFNPSLVAHKLIKRTTAVGFNGAVDNGSLLSVNEIHIGGIRFSNINLYVCERKCVNLVGMGILDRFKLRTDSVNGEQVMTLELK